MKKILWLSNCPFMAEQMHSTGTWIISMGEALLKTGEIELYNITYGNVEEFTECNVGGIRQWIIPQCKVNSKGLPSEKIISFLKQKEIEISPDIIHIWGTEYYWGMLAATGVFSSSVLLDIQGLLYAYSRVFYGGLTNKQLLKCIGLKELLLPKRLAYFRYKDFVRRGQLEKKVLKNIHHISVQSNWVKSHIMLENNNCHIYETGIVLRKQFYNADSWTLTSTKSNPIIFTSSSGSNMYKGLHVLFNSLAVLKTKYPSIKLHIAGSIIYDRWLQDGYSAWLLKEAERLDLIDSIVWLGPLSADQIIKQLLDASVFVVPSYVETYCLALAEAMIIGTPCVVSYAGAMPELASHENSALYFPLGDYMTCAWQVEKLLSNKNQTLKISQNAREVATQRNKVETVVQNQLNIYRRMLEENDTKNSYNNF